MRPFFISAFLILFIFPAFSQQPPLIHVKKEKTLLFFQKGAKSDTIIRNKSDLFFFSLPDSLKGTVSIYTENGRLEPLPGDTLLRFVFLKGLRYELFFKKEEKQYKLQSLINGASELIDPKVLIQLFDKSLGKEILSNRFTYKVH